MSYCSVFATRETRSAWSFRRSALSAFPFQASPVNCFLASAQVLKKAGLTLKDIDVFEFHEAFAGQVLSNLEALNSQSWCQEWVKQDRIGEMPMELTNTRGGSLSVGHPFGATGCRLVTWASDRLKAEDKEYAVLAACAAGGQGVAMLLERHPDW